MKNRIILVFTAIVLLWFNGYSQQNSMQIVSLSDTMSIPYTVISDSSSMTDISIKSYPVYIMDQLSFDATFNMLESYAESELLFATLSTLQSDQDSVGLQREKLLTEIIERQEARITLYRDNFYEVSELNKRLSENLDWCINFAEKEQKRATRRFMVWGGIGGFAVGIITGLIIAL